MSANDRRLSSEHFRSPLVQPSVHCPSVGPSSGLSRLVVARPGDEYLYLQETERVGSTQERNTFRGRFRRYASVLFLSVVFGPKRDRCVCVSRDYPM